MLKSKALWTLALAGAMVAGCNKDETKPMPPAAPTTPTVPPVTTPSIPALPTTRPTIPDISIPALPSTGPAAGTGTSGDTTTDAANAKAQTLLEQVQAAIKDKKWDDADALLKKLEDMKDKLSPDLQKQIATLRTAIDAGKATPKLPGGLGLPENK